MYTSDEQNEKKIKETIPFAVASKKNKIFRKIFNLFSELQNLYSENYKACISLH